MFAIWECANLDDEQLKALLLEHRRGRDGFDALAVRVVQLYMSGELLPPIADGAERPLSERLESLTASDVEAALRGDLGAVPMTRDEYQSVLSDILAFVKAWLGGEQ